MDGNGRWALGRGLPREAGHRAGVETVSRIVEAAPGAGIGILSLFAFSSDNWQRPRLEVDALMRLLAVYLEKEADRCLRNGVRLEVIGRRDRLNGSLQKAIAQAEQIISKAREATVLERQRMLIELKREVGALVVQTTGLVAGKVLTAEDQQRLVEETRRQLAA